MTNSGQNNQEVDKEDVKNVDEGCAWHNLLGCTWKTPLGFIGIGLTTVSITLIVLGLIGHLTGLIQNQYFAIFTFLFLPAMMKGSNW